VAASRSFVDRRRERKKPGPFWEKKGKEGGRKTRTAANACPSSTRRCKGGGRYHKNKTKGKVGKEKGGEILITSVAELTEIKKKIGGRTHL